MIRSLFLLIIFLIEGPNITANPTLPTNLHRLVVPTIPPLSLTRESYNATLSIAPESLEGIIGRRLKVYAFCKGQLFSNCNDCEKERVGLPPSFPELQGWYKNKHCTIGKVCQSSADWFGTGDCTGLDAQRCHEEGPFEEVVEGGLRQLKDDKGCYTSALHDTCTQDFACSLESNRYPVHLFTDDDSVRAKIVLPDDRAYTLNRTAHKIYIPLDSASSLAFFPEPRFEIKQYNIKVSCYKKFGTDPLCQLPQDPNFPDLANTIIQLNEGRDAGSVRNVHLKVHQLIFEIPDNNKVYLPNSSVKSVARRRREILQRIPELRSLENAVFYVAHESAYNDFNIIKSVDNVRNVLIQLLKSVSYRDPEVLGRVSGHNRQTSWFSENLFAFRDENFETAADPNSNCNERGQIFKDGSFVKRMKGDLCYEAADVSSKVDNVNLFEDSPYVFSDVSIQKFVTRLGKASQPSGQKSEWYAESPWYSRRKESEEKDKSQISKTKMFLQESGYVIAWSLFALHLYKIFKEMNTFHFLCLTVGFCAWIYICFLHPQIKRIVDAFY
ncbi:unnamed protein product [Bemisia tabaci]|uniref:Uncharacterized protein n=1 Tax=Bemisia tabaci TaxID=7038 RepID=A0A9P0A5M4_BEMTA|nr:unnamed protein product [Bemisia tabaci]